MESIRQNPEIYCRPVSCFAETWTTVTDKDRLSWLQTKIVNNATESVVLVTTNMDETIQAAEHLDFIRFTQHADVDVGTVSNEQEIVLAGSPSKRLKLDEHATTSVELSDFICHFPE